MITPQIVVAAAHCLGNPDHTYTNEIYTPDNLFVSKPGANIDMESPDDPIKVMRVVLTSGYNNSFHPEAGNFITQKDDIAFYFLQRPLLDKYSIPIATLGDVSAIKTNRLMITHIGYGLHGVDLHDGIPRIVQLQAYPQGSSRYGNNPARDDFTITSQETGDKALCPGDSGSPWYATVNGVEKLVAVTVSASGCRVGSNQTGGTMGTLIYPYLDLVDRHWEEFLKELPSLIASDPSIVDMSLPYIERDGGCDALVNAWLQIQNIDGTWSDFRKAQGWRKVPTSCPDSNPYHPWVRATVPNGSNIRWKIVALDNSWTFLTTPYIFQDLTQPTSPAVAQSSKKILIHVCKKGALIKKIREKQPSCPKGYKLQK